MSPGGVIANSVVRERFGYQPLVWVVAAFAAGLLVDRWAALPATAWWIAALAAWFVWWIHYRAERNRLAAVAVLISVASAGAAWHHARWSLFGRDDLGHFAAEYDRPVCVEVIALDGPRRIPAGRFDPLRALPTYDRSRLSVRVARARDAAHWQDASGRATLTVNGHLLGVHSGDRLRVFARLSAPRRAANPGEFDIAEHARADRKLCQLWADYPDCVSVIAPAGMPGPFDVIDRMRMAGDRLLWQHLSHERSGLAAAVLLGLREQLEPARTERFLTTGTVHLLAISGLHVGILASLLFLFMRLGLFGQRTSLAAVALLTVGYALLTDAQPPVVRAAIMVLVLCWALWRYRIVSPFNLLAAAALVVLVMNPADLFRTGPQLSFLAMITIFWIGPRIFRRREQDPLDRLIARTRPWPQRMTRNFVRWAWRATLLTAMIWAVLLPLVLTRFHVLSLVALALNPILWLPVAGALFFGFGVLLFGWLVPPLASLCGGVCDGSLAVLETAVDWASRLPGGHVWVAGPNGWWLAVFYAALAFVIAMPRLVPPRRWCVGLVCAWIGVGLGASWLKQSDRQLACTFLSVGHGCAVVVELPDGKTLLYDVGRLGAPYGASRAVAGHLWSRGIHHIDAVVLSHADIDHFNGLPGLLDQFSVGVVYTSPMMFEEESASLTALSQALAEAKVPVVEIQAGDRLSTDECRIDVWHPTREGVLDSDNANSVVLSIEYQGRRIMLPGDLESLGLDYLFAEEPYDTDVLLAPHHGSPRSDPPGFAAWSTPEWIVISGGHNDNVARIAQAYERQGGEVLDTAHEGAVTVTVANGELGVTTMRMKRP